MKKVLLLLTIPLLVAGLQAQTQTTPIVSTTDIIFNMCPPLENNESETVCHESDVPFVWNGIITIPSEKEPGVYQLQRDILNEDGCTVNAKMELTVATCHPEGAILHKFSVGNNGTDTSFVYFSQGNLQYRASNGMAFPSEGCLKHKVAGGEEAQGEWRFAEEQYTVVGFSWPERINGTVYEGGTLSANNQIAQTYTGWIDLFGFGTSGYNEKYPWLKGTSNYSYPSGDLTGTNYDWGQYNAISNGGNEPGIWRTLTWNEWDYLLYKRCGSGINAEKHMHGVSLTIGTVTYKGLMLLPDDWSWEKIGLTEWSKTNNSARYDYSISQTDWKQYKKNGAVFLIAFVYRNDTKFYPKDSWSDNPQYGNSDYSYLLYYWTSDQYSSDSGKALYMHKSQGQTSMGMGKYLGLPVRLVTDVKPCDN